MPTTSPNSDLRTKAEELRRLHHATKILVLPNAWDVTSARLLEDMGFPAVATSSAAVANSLGYPDGQQISRHEMLEAVGRIASAVQVPVTADMEAGYATTAEEMEVTARDLLEAGAVGLNLEDSADNESVLLGLDQYLEKLHDSGSVEECWLIDRHQCTNRCLLVERRESWKQARRNRSSCERISGSGRRLCVRSGTLRPLGYWTSAAGKPGADQYSRDCENSAHPGTAKTGIARVSFGSGGYRTAIGAFRKLVQEAIDSGTYNFMSDIAVTGAQNNALHQRKS